jgi:hypothetical protein
MVNTSRSFSLVRRLIAVAVLAPPGAFGCICLAGLLDFAGNAVLGFVGAWAVGLGVWTSRGARSGLEAAALIVAGICLAALSIAATAFAWFWIACHQGGCFD